MARTATVTINDVTYTLLFNTRVLAEMEDAGYVYAELWKNVDRSAKTRVLLLSHLMQQGYKYDLAEGLEPPKPLTVDELLDNTDWSEQENFYSAVLAAMDAGNKRTVEARPKSKKANGATQAE